MPEYMEFFIEPEMIIGYEGETDWLKLYDDKKKLRAKIEERRGIYLFSVDPPEINIEIYKRLHGNSPSLYSQITHIGGMKPKNARTVRNDIFARAVNDFYRVKDRDPNLPSLKLHQRKKTRIMREFGESFYLKIYYTDSDEAEMDLLNRYIKKFETKPPWDL